MGAAQATGSPGAEQPTDVSSPAAPTVAGLPPVATSLRYDTDYPLIGYADRPTHNAIARLQDRLDQGATKLKFVPGRGYLDSLLQTLGIDPRLPDTGLFQDQPADRSHPRRHTARDLLRR